MSQNDVEENEDRGMSLSWIVMLLLCVVTPITVISAVLTYLAFAWQRIKLKVIFFYGFIPSFLIFLLLLNPAIEMFMTSWNETIPSIVEQRVEIFPTILFVFLQQLPIALPSGVLLGIIYSAFKWRQRPEWVEKKFRATPYEVYKKRKTIQNIKRDLNSPKNGMTLGVDMNGERVVQTYAESAAHTLVMGASGSGKTTTMKSRLRDALKAGQGAVVIDLKGDPAFAHEVAELAHRYGHRFQHWLMQPRDEPYTGPAVDGPAYYDPIARGDATRRKDLIMEMREWSEDYYRLAAAGYLQVVMNVIIGNPDPEMSTLSQLTRLLDPKALQERAIPLGSNPIYQDIVKYVDDLNDQKMDAKAKGNLESLRSQFVELLMSIAGQYLQTDPDTTRNNNISLKKTAHNGDVVFFSLDSSNYGGIASVVANLLIQDLKTVSSELRADPAPQSLQIVLDEFQAVGSANIIGLINKSRDANIPVTLATQALGDLRQIGDAFLDQLIGIVGSFIIHRPNSEQDAKLFAGLTGTVTRKRVSEAYSTGQGGLINQGSVLGTGVLQEYEDYNVKPNEILNLRQGEMIYVNKYSSPMRVEKVLCIPEEGYIAEPETTRKLTTGTSEPGSPVEQKPENSTHVPEIPTGLPLNTKDDYSPPIIESKPPDMNRLREIFSQDPNDLLGEEEAKNPTTRDNYIVEVLPPKVAQPLNVPEVSNTPKKFPALPPLPQIPTPVVKPPVSDGNKTVSDSAVNSGTGNKTEGTGDVSDTGKTTVKPINNGSVKKDEFDF